jgi:hypothetical protein
MRSILGSARLFSSEDGDIVCIASMVARESSTILRLRRSMEMSLYHPSSKKEESTVRKRLLEAGFEEEFVGEDRPPATHYHYGKGGGFYAEFLAPLEGSEYDRNGKRKATKEVGGVSSQLLRYIEILLISPWKVELGEENGYALSPKRTVQIANPASFLTQKILIHKERDYKDRAKDLLYMHDTIEVFSETLEELQKIFRKDVAPKLHPRRIAELEGSADKLFGKSRTRLARQF